MKLEHCAFCGKSIVPELPHYCVGNLCVCLRCGGIQTIASLAGLNAGFSVTYDRPIDVDYTVGMPHIEVEDVDGELMEKSTDVEEKSTDVEEKSTDVEEKSADELPYLSV